MLQGSIVSPRKMYQLILMNVCLFVNTRVHGLPAGQTFKMAKAQFGQRFPNYNHYSSKKYDLLQFFRHLNPRRKGRRRRRCSVLVLSTSHCFATTARQLVYFVLHIVWTAGVRQLQAVFVILAEKKERGSTSIYPPPWSRIYFLAWLV